MTKPTVGRIVHFYRDSAAFHDGNPPQAAIIAHVWTDTCVNLAIFDGNGKQVPEPPTSVALVHDDSIPQGCPFCVWPPRD